MTPRGDWNTRRRAATALAALVAAALAGCWDMREVRDTAFVLAAGFDRAPSAGGAGGVGEAYQLVVQIPVAERLPGAGGGGGGGAQGPATWTTTVAGATPIDASHRLLAVATKRPYWGQLQVAVLGEELARQGAGGVLDMLARAPEIPETAKIIVARGSAANLMRATPQLDPIPARALSRLITQPREESTLPDIDVHEFADRVLEEGVDPIVPFIARSSNGEFSVLGSAAFSGLRMVGAFDADETQGYTWVRGRSPTGHLVISCPGSETPDNKTSIEVHQRRVNVRVEDGDSLPRVTIAIRARGLVVDRPCLAPLNAKNTEIEQLAARRIRSQVEAAIARSRQLKADVFGFGREIHRRRPATWQRVRRNWADRLAALPVDVSVDFLLSKRAIAGEPIRPDAPGPR